MYIRKTTKHYKGRNYHNYLLVESVATPKGPRQRIICSLGSLSPGPRQKWRELAREGESPEVGLMVEKVEQEQPQRSKRPLDKGRDPPRLNRGGYPGRGQGGRPGACGSPDVAPPGGGADSPEGRSSSPGPASHRGHDLKPPDFALLRTGYGRLDEKMCSFRYPGG